MEISGPLELSEESWFHVFTFLDASDLCRLSQVCRWWYSLSSDDLLWKALCRILWHDKQCMRFEKWSVVPQVLLDKTPLPPQQLEREDGSMDRLKALYREALREYQVAESIMARTINILRRERHMHARARRGDGDGDQEGDENDGMLHVNMRDLLHLQNLSHSVGVKRERLIKLHDRLRFLKHPRGSAVYLRQAAPLSRIAKELNVPVSSVTPLNWKESYIASVLDSRRICPMYAELEGDWILSFDGQLEIGRFVEGGTMFIDNRGFSENAGQINVSGDRLYIGGIPHTCRRRPDWGWFLEGDNGFVNLFSFDPRFPPPRNAMPLLTRLRERYEQPVQLADLLRMEEDDEYHFTDVSFIPTKIVDKTDEWDDSMDLEKNDGSNEEDSMVLEED